MTPLFILPCLAFSLQSLYLPDLFVKAELTSRDLALAANYFVELGETRTCKKLTEMASNEYYAWPLSLLQWHDFSKSTRVCWMCRILYEPKKSVPLDEPDLPATMPHMPRYRWPLFPLARAGDTYFVLSEAGIVMNRSGAALAYLRYCKAEGTFRILPVTVPDRAQALKDCARLLESKNWKAIKWTDRGPGWSYSYPEEPYLRYIKAQAQGIPEK